MMHYCTACAICIGALNPCVLLNLEYNRLRAGNGGWVKPDANNLRVKSKPPWNQTPSMALSFLCQSAVTFVMRATLSIRGCLLHWPRKV